MSLSRRRRIVWAVVLSGALFAYVFLAHRLAARDPITEVLLGRVGSILPLAGTVLLLRVTIIVVLPVVLALVAASLVLDRGRPR